MNYEKKPERAVTPKKKTAKEKREDLLSEIDLIDDLIGEVLDADNPR